MKLVTQKATSFSKIAGQHGVLHGGTLSADMTPEEVLWALKQVSGDFLFLRPCPENPNHGQAVGGFQSEKVTRYGAFMRVAEMFTSFKASGTKADLIAMRYIDATHSAVGSPGNSIIVGKGNAGVTSGQGIHIAVPLRPYDSLGNWLDDQPFTDSEVEVEYVREGDVWHIVQLRKAAAHIHVDPPPKGSLPGFLPQQKFSPKQIYIVQNLDDLGELEHAKLDAQHTLVIQREGSMMSHAAAHCRGSNMAFVIADPDGFKVGEMLTQVAQGWVMQGDHDGVKPYSPADFFPSFIKGFKLLLPHRVHVPLGTFFHQWATTPLFDPDMCALLAGVFARSIVALAASACIGETRHFGYINNLQARDIAQKALKDAGITAATTRSTIYAKFSHGRIMVKDLKGLLEFSRRTFNQPWSHGSFGGPKWETCAERGIYVLEAIAAGKPNQVIKAVNDLENAVHNNGSLFTKFKGMEDELNVSTQGFVSRMNSWQQETLSKICDTAFKIIEETDELAKVKPQNNAAWVSIVNAATEIEVDDSKPKKKTKSPTTKGDGDIVKVWIYEHV